MEAIRYEAELCKAVYRDSPGTVHSDIGATIPIEDRRTDTQLFVFVDYGNKHIHVCVRGSSSRKDWINNFLSAKTNYHGIKAHSGYVKAAESVRRKLLKLLRGYPGFKITVSGHSLGGAVAVLLMIDIVEQFQVDGRANEFDLLTLITFGQRRVSTKRHLDRVLHCRYIRVTNGSDVAPRTPYVGYSHTGTLLYIPNGENVVGITVDPSWMARFSDRLFTLRQRGSDHTMDHYIRDLNKIRVAL